jgi:Rrf2 family cysteine metabolism transcriptional repressor
MVLSQKSQYAVRAVLELAKRQGSGPVKAAIVAEAQRIPGRFLDNILFELRQGGVVASRRGREGGYLLSRQPGGVTVGDIVRLMQGPLPTVDCVAPGSGRYGGAGRECGLYGGCVLQPLWDRAQTALMEVLDGTSFADLMEQERVACVAGAIDYAI